VFVLREREKQEKALKRQENLKTKIWEKHRRDTDTVAISQLRMSQTRSALNNKDNRHEHIFQGRRKEKEQMNDFIAKKREMFLVQMSLDNYRKEIEKLGETAKMKEERLARAEKMLEDDAVRFDTFLRENDRLTYEVMQRAEQETKEKLNKALQLKRLIQEIGRAEGEVEKLTEQLQVCDKYKRFLDAHTPPEFLAKAEARRAERLAQNPEANDDVSEDEMYFKDPQQLLSLFAQLEERNLFLIQSVQEGEEALGELRSRCSNTGQEAEDRVQSLAKSVKSLQTRIEQEETRANSLNTDVNTQGDVGVHQQLLEQLTHMIADTYKSVVGDSSHQVEGPLDMLTKLEEELEGAVREIQRYASKNRNLVIQLEKEKESQRRANVRTAKTKEAERQNRERLAISLARAQAAVRPKAGRPLMARSIPAKKKVEETRDSSKDEAAEEYRMFFCE